MREEGLSLPAAASLCAPTRGTHFLGGSEKGVSASPTSRHLPALAPWVYLWVKQTQQVAARVPFLPAQG